MFTVFRFVPDKSVQQQVFYFSMLCISLIRETNQTFVRIRLYVTIADSKSRELEYIPPEYEYFNLRLYSSWQFVGPIFLKLGVEIHERSRKLPFEFLKVTGMYACIRLPQPRYRYTRAPMYTLSKKRKTAKFQT